MTKYKIFSQVSVYIRLRLPFMLKLDENIMLYGHRISYQLLNVRRQNFCYIFLCLLFAGLFGRESIYIKKTPNKQANKHKKASNLNLKNSSTNMYVKLKSKL